MNISNILTEKNIFLNLKSNNKREFLQDLAQKVSEVLDIDTLSLFDSILERENLGSTGFGSGTALPHSRFSGVDKVRAFFAKHSYPPKHQDLQYLL